MEYSRERERIKMAPHSPPLTASQGLSSSQVNTISHHSSSTRALQAKLRPKTRIKMVIITFSRGKSDTRFGWMRSPRSNLGCFNILQWYSYKVNLLLRANWNLSWLELIIHTDYMCHCTIPRFSFCTQFHTGRIQGFSRIWKLNSKQGPWMSIEM